MKKEFIDRIFMFVFGMMGLFLFSMCAYSFNVMNENCTTTVIYDGILTVMMLGVVMLTISITYLFCVWRGGNCYNSKSEDTLAEIYIAGGSVLSFVVLVILSVSIGKLSKEKECLGNNGVEDSNGKQLKFNLWLMFGMTLLAFIASSIGNYYINFVIPGQFKGQLKKGDKAKVVARGKPVANLGPKMPKLDSGGWGALPTNPISSFRGFKRK